MRFLDDTRPDVATALRERVPAATLEALTSAPRTAWLPIEIDGPYVDTFVEILGVDEATLVWREFMRVALAESRFIRTLLQGAIRLFGLSVRSLTQALPNGFRQSHRDVSRVTLDRSGVPTLTMDDIAPQVFDYPAYVHAFRGVFLGLYDIAGVEPQLEFIVDREARRIVGRFHE